MKTKNQKMKEKMQIEIKSKQISQDFCSKYSNFQQMEKKFKELHEEAKNQNVQKRYKKQLKMLSMAQAIGDSKQNSHISAFEPEIVDSIDTDRKIEDLTININSKENISNKKKEELITKKLLELLEQNELKYERILAKTKNSLNEKKSRAILNSQSKNSNKEESEISWLKVPSHNKLLSRLIKIRLIEIISEVIYF